MVSTDLDSSLLGKTWSGGPLKLAVNSLYYHAVVVFMVRSCSTFSRYSLEVWLGFKKFLNASQA